DKATIVSSDRTIAEKTQSLADLETGTDPLDIQSQQLSIKQKENALLDAQQTLADYSVRAPFDGIIAVSDLGKGETVSSGTTVVTLITKQSLATIALNEVDVAKVKVGQKVTLTFDAIADLTISGEVAEIDSIGTVSQGVVSYNVKISFDTQDERIKPGMSISASIITEVKTDVLMAPNAAVKSQNDADYVEMPTDQNLQTSTAISSAGITLSQPTKRQPVEIGIANDTYTEIISGLNEGDLIIKSTTTNSSSTSTNGSSKNNSSLGGGMMMLGGGAPR
ncbi:MAG: efflux RND transporter periplasmic adaptor subunit, partial [bacterium]